MALANIAEWNQFNQSRPCGAACGAADNPEEKPAACGASEAPAACGAAENAAEAPTACGAVDKPEEKPASCGTACGAGGNK